MRKQFTDRPARLLAALGLIVAMTGIGAAGAATIINGNKIKNKTVGLAKLKPATIKALKGKPGAKGPAGAPGAQGVQGPAGVSAGGGSGSPGAPGSAGAAGATGPAGAGVTPLTFGPFAYTQLDHNQVCGGPQWATDTGNVTYVVTPTVTGLFNVVELRSGTFVVNSGNLAPISSYPLDATINSPGGTGGCGFAGSRVSAGVTGRFYGQKVYLDFSAAFDFTATCSAGCSSAAFFNTFFGTPTPPPVGSDQAHYRSDGGNAWNWNQISGPPNSGDILQ